MFKWLKKKQPEIEAPDKTGFFNTDMFDFRSSSHNSVIEAALKKSFLTALPAPVTPEGVAMDASQLQNQKSMYTGFGPNIPANQIAWYGSQGFIGFQTAALIAQNWLVDKACTIPARDCVRTGYRVTIEEGTDQKEEILKEMKVLDTKFKLNHNLVQLVRMGRVFGIRIALFVVDSKDPKYYEYPFNIDGVEEGSYKGISQVDPYWMTPEFDTQAVTNPGAIDFYEPTWWTINGRRIHKSHLIVFRTGEVADVLKPTYLYGGVSIPQKIFERVYGAERTANEAPILAMTKRLTVIHCDVAAALANQKEFEKRMQFWQWARDNLGIKIAGTEEQVEQFDTSLGDLDNVIMTQYQIVAAAANVPVTKLLGTVPKGFNSTGEYDETSYHEELESIQTHDLTPMIDRHHQLCMKSYVMPKLKLTEMVVTSINWNPLDTPTAKELAEINKAKADTGNILVSSGAIDPMEERSRVANDPDSGYEGLEVEILPSEEISGEENDEE